MADVTLTSRAMALAELIRRVGGEAAVSPSAHAVKVALDRKDASHLFFEVVNNDSLNAVARLEAPLRERGPDPWQGPSVAAPCYYDGRNHGWVAEWSDGPLSPVDPFPRGEAKTEPRARLLAVLKALLHEETSHG